MHLLMGASAPTKQMRISRCFFLLRQLFQFPHIGKFVHDLLEAAACDGADGCSDCALDQRQSARISFRSGMASSTISAVMTADPISMSTITPSSE